MANGRLAEVVGYVGVGPSVVLLSARYATVTHTQTRLLIAEKYENYLFEWADVAAKLGSQRIWRT